VNAAGAIWATYFFFFFAVFFFAVFRFAFFVADDFAAAIERVLRRFFIGMDLIPCRLQEASLYRKMA